MTLLKNLTLKNLALTAIAFVASLMSILALNFGIVGNSIQEPVSAKEWLFRAEILHSFEISGFGTLLVAVSFIMAVGTLVLFAATFILSKKATYLKGMRLVTLLSLLATLVLMVAGFLVSGDYAGKLFGDITELKKHITTQAYIPFIINVAICGAYFGADMFLRD